MEEKKENEHDNHINNIENSKKNDEAEESNLNTYKEESEKELIFINLNDLPNNKNGNKEYHEQENKIELEKNNLIKEENNISNSEDLKEEKNKQNKIDIKKENNSPDNLDIKSDNKSLTSQTNSNSDNPSNNELENDILSPDEFKKLYNKLHQIAETKKLDKMIQEITTLLESATEHIINGDKKDPKIFELFSSSNFIRDLITIMSKKCKAINIQIIKFFSVLMTNLSEKHIIYFLFNCDFINQHVYEDNEPIEGDYLYYYISFVKSLILKINIKTIGMFYHHQSYTFPLLGNCLKFYNHPDSMISNTIRNIFLCILKINYPPSIEYICTLPMLTYFIFLSCRLRDEIKTLNKKIKKNNEEDCSILHEEIINDIMYFQDIFSIGIVKINFILINCIFHFLILPVICNSIIYSSDLDKSLNSSSIEGNRSQSFEISIFNFNFNLNNNTNTNNNKNINPLFKHCINPELAIYILNIFLKYIKNDTFLNLLISLFFLPKIHHKLIDKLKKPIKDLENYEGDYNNKAKKKINFIKYIILNFSHPFIQAQINNPVKTFPEFKKIEKRLSDKLKENKISFNLTQPVPFGFLMEFLNGYFSNRELKECREYDEIVSESTGIQCGLTYRFDRKCFVYLMQKNLKYITNNYSFEKVESKFIDNEIYSSFINSYKDSHDLFLILSNLLFHQIITNKYISKELLSYVKLLPPKEINKNIINNIEEEDSPALKVGEIIESKDKPQKKKFQEVLTFSNLFKAQYKKDFIIKEFNLYDNDKLSKTFFNGEMEYNSNLFGDVISYINRDGILKPEVYLFIFKLINALIVFEENNEKKNLELRSIHKSIIKSAFNKNIEQIKNIINEGEISEIDLKTIYNFLWGNKQLDIFQDYENMSNNIINNCLFLLHKDENINGNIIPGIDIFNNLLINNIDLKIRIYLFKGILQLLYEIKEIKEEEIGFIELNDKNIENAKNIIIDNLNKLTLDE